MSRAPGALAIVLHTHMPYVEGFGTWPFGEEWLWEAIATCYLPLLDALDAAPGRVTLSVTPVLGDQLEAPGALERCRSFLRELRAESHRLDVAAARDRAEAAALEHSAAAYARAAGALGDDLPARLAAHASWTSAATHAVLPLLATHGSVRLQLATGIAAHRAR
jgi:1,4-alpha-glucan branching enzyme